MQELLGLSTENITEYKLAAEFSCRKAFFIVADVLKRKLPIILDAERLFSTVKMYFYTSNGGKRLNKKAPCFHKVP